LKVIIVVVQVGAVKIYVAAVEALRKKERGGQNSMKLKVIIVVVQVGAVKIYVAAACLTFQ